MSRYQPFHDLPRHTHFEQCSGAAYDDLRRSILAANPVCPCGAPTAEVDHIWPRYYGGAEHPANLQALCGDCNRRKGRTVDIAAATPEELRAAVSAIAARIVEQADDMSRFVDELLGREVEASYALPILAMETSARRAASALHYSVDGLAIAQRAVDAGAVAS